MTDNNLVKIDFTKGVKAEPINKNFNLLETWVDKERLQSAGWGIVSGFEFSRRGDEFVIDVSEGVLINRKGHQVDLDKTSINVGAPIPITQYEQFTLDESGQIEVRFPIYSPSQLKQINYLAGSYGELPSDTEFRVYDTETMEILQVASINRETISLVDPIANAGRKVEVVYQYASSHIDTITYNENTPELYPKYTYGIFSSSPSLPSKTTFEEQGDIILGWAYWTVNEDGISVQFIYDRKDVRSIRVDNQGDIYFYGKKFEPNERKFVYFVEPKDPQENDLWYDYDTNILYIWRQYNGNDYEWVPVNDHSSFDVKEVKLFLPEETNNETQVFTFNENETNLHFIPRSNALDVYIDQAYVMQDQYVEMVLLKETDRDGHHLIVPDGPQYKLSDIICGVGFKLNYPLNEPTVVQANVKHTIKKPSETSAFQRAAIFVEEERIIYNEDTYPNYKRVITLPTQFEYGKNQIELYLNGIKLHTGSSNDIDFSEVMPVATENNPNPTLTNQVIINQNVKLKYGDRIIYRISHYVWSYEQLESIVANAQSGINEAKNMIREVDNKYKTIVDTLDPAVEDIQSDVKNLKESTLNTDIFVKKTDKITKDMLDEAVANGLYKSLTQYDITIDPSATIYPLQHTLSERQITFVLLDPYVGNTAKIDNASIKTILNYQTDYVFVDNNKIKLSAGLVRTTRKLHFMVIDFGI